MPKRQVGIGDVVMINNKEHVLVKATSNENMASTAYDRTYCFCLREDFHRFVEKHNGIVPEEEWDLFAQISGRHQDIKGIEYPEFQFADVAPYEFSTVRSVKVRQKQPKQITVYE